MTPGILAQQIDRRFDMYAFGVEVGADAAVLAISGLKRLVWAKPHFTMVGGNGMPGARIHSPTTLEIRTFKRVPGGPKREDYLQWDCAAGVFSGGRLSPSRLQAHQELIDDAFGPGATQLLRIGATILFDEDVVRDYLVKYKARQIVLDPKTAELIERVRKATFSKDGMRL